MQLLLLLSWGTNISIRGVINSSDRNIEGFTSYCSWLLVEELLLPSFKPSSRYCFLNPVARILGSGVSFVRLCFYGFRGIKPLNYLKSFQFFSVLLNIIIFISTCLLCVAFEGSPSPRKAAVCINITSLAPVCTDKYRKRIFARWRLVCCEVGPSRERASMVGWVAALVVRFTRGQ